MIQTDVHSIALQVLPIILTMSTVLQVSVMLLASTLLLVALPARAEERPGQLAHVS